VNSELFAKIVVVAIILLVSFPVHEASHAFAAYRLGDGTAKLFGRLSLNPIVHFDPIGGLMLIVSFLAANFGFGWAKPTPVNPRMLRGGRSSEALVAAAGPLSNLVLAAIGGIIIRIVGLSGLRDLPDVVSFVLVYFVYVNLALMVFNFVPIPPLDGSKVLFAALDPSTEMQVRPMLEQYGFVILLVFIIPLGPSGSILGQLLQGIINPLFNLVTGTSFL
jgi:Zn-dependent protease